MKTIFLTISLLIISAISYAQEYTVTTYLDEFIIGEGAIVFIELRIKPNNSNWISDASGRSIIFSSDCVENSLTAWIHSKVSGTGLKEIGPFHVQVGSEIVKSSSMKVYVVPKFDGAKDFYVIGKKDPNGRDLFQIKIEYKTVQKKGSVGVISLKDNSLPNGLELKSGSSSHGLASGQCSYTLKILSKERRILDRKNFANVPVWLNFPEIIISSQ